MQLAQEDTLNGTPNIWSAATHDRKENVRTPEELAGIVTRFAASGGWLHRVRLRTDERWYERLHHGEDHDIWVISWMPGQSTGFHDHGESAGAFSVVSGTLEEHQAGEAVRSVPSGEVRTFGAEYAHDVRNGSLAPAISIHAYSPPLSEMNEYELQGDELVPRVQPTERAQNLDARSPIAADKGEGGSSPSGIDQLLAAARARLRRLSPAVAHQAVLKGDAILVDIRPEAQRQAEGSIPGALIVERNVLEWRFDPTCSARLEVATSHDSQVILFCSEGYTSSLAAAALQDVGLWRATDIVGGFKAWQSGGLPSVASADLNPKD